MGATGIGSCVDGNYWLVFQILLKTLVSFLPVCPSKSFLRKTPVRPGPFLSDNSRKALSLHAQQTRGRGRKEAEGKQGWGLRKEPLPNGNGSHRASHAAVSEPRAFPERSSWNRPRLGLSRRIQLELDIFEPF